ncbi:MAG: HAD family hydrolase [Omnitrophica WOR_2 bacterium]
MLEVKAVIFDLDGVLVNTEKIVYQAFQDILRPLGKALDEKDAEIIVGLDREDTSRYVSAKTGYPGSPSRLDQDHWSHFLSLVSRGIEPVPGARKLINDLIRSGYPLAVASNSPIDYVQDILRATQLEAYFQSISARDQVANGKPAPDLYLRAAAALHLPPERCLAVEDSPVGVQSALSAGLYCVVIAPDSLQEPVFQSVHARFPTLQDLANSVHKILPLQDR